MPKSATDFDCLNSRPYQETHTKQQESLKSAEAECSRKWRHQSGFTAQANYQQLLRSTAMQPPFHSLLEVFACPDSLIA